MNMNKIKMLVIALFAIGLASCSVGPYVFIPQKNDNDHDGGANYVEVGVVGKGEF